MRGFLVKVIAAGAVATCPAIAAACPQTAYVARIGTLSPAAHCGELVATTDPGTPDRSTAVVTLRTHVGADFTVSVRWQQLTGDSGTLQLRVPGGVLLVRDGKIGLYTSEAAWSEHGYRPLEGKRTTDMMTVRVRGKGDAVDVWVDGAPAGTWKVAARPVTDIEIGMVGPVGTRSRMWFSELADTSR